MAVHARVLELCIIGPGREDRRGEGGCRQQSLRQRSVGVSTCNLPQKTSVSSSEFKINIYHIYLSDVPRVLTTSSES